MKLKETVDEALLGCPGQSIVPSLHAYLFFYYDVIDVQKCLVFKRTGGEVGWNSSRDVWAHDLLKTVRPVCPCEVMDSEDTMFILYTSGSTGKPKGVAHSTAGKTYSCYSPLFISDSQL